jgi:hypothetical protein
LHPVVLADGRAAGLWRGGRQREAYWVEVEPFDPLPPGVHRKLAAEVERVGRFLRVPAEVRGGDL